jgi:hypothetical protein
MHFLGHLQEFGATAPTAVAARSLNAALEPVFLVVRERLTNKFQEKLFNEPSDGPDWFKNLRHRILSEQVAAMHRAIEALPETEMIGVEQDDGLFDQVVQHLIDRHFEDIDESHIQSLKNLSALILSRRVLMSAHTGVIVAGFGYEDLFPTLISFEVYGSVRGQLRFFRTNYEDVDRGGTKAKVIPFAQKEMVERFLYGLDDDIQRRISDFCKNSIPRIRELTLEKLEMDEGDRQITENDMKAAEEAFLEALREQTFDTIRGQNQDEIEDMVEFMPKSEMAKMAEALVNLTSIKRRVSRGMETVGGPIDVAVISQSDGFVWVQRKHYFPQELNSRFFDRMREQNFEPKEA